MKSLKSILESILIKPTKIKETSSYKEIWYQNLGVRFKAEYQQPLINGYLSTDELIEFGDAVIDKLHSKTNKVIKYMAKHWNLPNEYTNYEEFMKI